MHLSRYTKQFSYPEDPEYTLLYSTKKCASILLQKSALQAIEDKTLTPANQKKLFDLGFLVQDPDKEKQEMLAFYDEANKRNTVFKAYVILNLECNLNCVYCYEGDLKGQIYMTQETADDIISFIGQNYLGRVEKLRIDYYGGEPLLSLEMIKYISERLKRSAENAKTEYAFGLMTNGTLLTGKTAELLLPYGLKGARITLDGPRENHDRFRPFKAGTGTFDLIIKNIKETCELINIHIGGLYTIDNYRGFPKLLDCLLEQGLTPDKIASVRFDPVLTSPFKRTEFRTVCSVMNEPWLVEANIFLREEIFKRGFSASKVGIATCMVDIDNALAFNHDGSILKCPALMGFKDMGAGNIRTGFIDYKESHKLDLWKREDCMECEYLPLCFGGCRYEKLLQNGRLDSPDCQKSFFDATLETLVKQDLKYSKKIGPA